MRYTVGLLLLWGIVLTTFSQNSGVHTIKIHHRINQSDIDSSYMENGKQLEELSAFIDDGSTHAHIWDSIVISACSSPDGRQNANNRLSYRRAKSFYDYLLNIRQLPPPYT